MKELLKSKITKLILSVTVFLTVFDFIIPNYALASEGWQGALIEPITDFVCSIGDMFMNVMQGFMLPGAPKAVTQRSLYEASIMEDNGGEMDLWSQIRQGFADVSTGDSFFSKIPGVAQLSNIIATGAMLVTFQWDMVFMDRDQFIELYTHQAIPFIYYSPAAIFSNRVPGLDINFINPVSQFDKQYDFLLMFVGQFDNAEEYLNFMQTFYGLSKDEATKSWRSLQMLQDISTLEDGKRTISDENKQRFLSGTIKVKDEDTGSEKLEGNPMANSAVIIGPVISKWYVALRNIATVGLLIVLVYIGIRILISSVSEQVAKYKMMLKDWVIAIVLVFFIHYIMLGLITINEAIINFLDDSAYGQQTEAVDNYEENLESQFQTDLKAFKQCDRIMTTVRLKESETRATQKESETGWIDTFGYALMYTILVVYTVVFTFKYLKRLVYMAFLTIIAPMVALTYPIDKAGDKQAQAFNMWFREYLFNLLIQPIHLLLYVVLVGAALDFAASNMLYAIVAIGFIMEAENFIRKMFGIRAEGGAFGNFAAGALFASGLNWVGKGASAVSSGIGKLGKGKGGDDKDDGKVRQQNVKDPNARIGLTEAFGNGQGNDENGATDGSNGGEGTGASGEEPGDGVPRVRLDSGTSVESGAGAEGLGAGTDPGRTAVLAGTPAMTLSNGQPSGGATRPRIRGFARFRRGVKSVFGLDPNQAPWRGRNAHKLATSAGRFGWNATKFVAKAGVRAGAIGTAGTIGLAAGLASGEGAGKYALAGLATGNVIGKSVNQIAGGTATALKGAGKDIAENYRRGAYTPEERAERNYERFRNQFLLDKNIDKEYKDKYGDRAEEMKDKYLEAVRYGEPDDVAMKLMERDVPAQQAMTVSDILKNDITRQQLQDPSSKEYQALQRRLASVTGDESERRRITNMMDQGAGLNPDEMNTIRDQYNAQIRAEQEAAAARERERQEAEQARIQAEQEEKAREQAEREAEKQAQKEIERSRNIKMDALERNARYNNMGMQRMREAQQGKTDNKIETSYDEEAKKAYEQYKNMGNKNDDQDKKE